MEASEIASQLRGFVRERFGVPLNDPDFTDDVDLFNFGYIDSFGAVDLAGYLEREFSITIGESDWATSSLNSISEIATFVSKRKKGES